MTIYVIYTKVLSVTEESEVIRVVRGTGKGEWIQEKHNLGWFVLFEGSHEKLHFGFDRPAFQPGDKVKLTIENLNATISSDPR